MRSKLWISALVLLVSSVSFARGRGGFDGPIGQAGQFDLYLLSLSWSPAFCASPAGQKPSNVDQCAAHAGFVLHGLWPQAAQGDNPQFCTPSDGVSVESVKPVMQGKLQVPPHSMGLLHHEWSKHGTCSGLSQAAYFQAAADAAARVSIPEPLENMQGELRGPTETLKALFIASNPGLQADQIVVKVDQRGNVYEINLCLDKQFGYTTCHNVHTPPPGTVGTFIPPAANPPATY